MLVNKIKPRIHEMTKAAETSDDMDDASLKVRVFFFFFFTKIHEIRGTCTCGGIGMADTPVSSIHARTHARTHSRVENGKAHTEGRRRKHEGNKKQMRNPSPNPNPNSIP